MFFSFYSFIFNLRPAVLIAILLHPHQVVAGLSRHADLIYGGYVNGIVSNLMDLRIALHHRAVIAHQSDLAAEEAALQEAVLHAALQYHARTLSHCGNGDKGENDGDQTIDHKFSTLIDLSSSYVAIRQSQCKHCSALIAPSVPSDCMDGL